MGVLSIIEGVVRLLIWPWRFREVRLLRETFGIVNMSLDYKESNQAQVKTTLTQLAEEMDAAFRVQEEERSLGQDISYYDWIARCKQRFWNAHALAKRNWFFVHLSYKDYLKK
ncbi:hypothetical protein HY045_00670 [Candidatus Woesebacteria bacterium]|nr:hypothetical protein [Candidatus Woesebacteria bacterium]